MYNIGYISLDSNWKKEYLDLFPEKEYQVNQLRITETELFSKQDILLIEEQSFKDFPTICQLLLEVKACKKTMVYIISLKENLDQAARIVYLQLGVNGIKDNSLDLEEFSFILKNLLIKCSDYQTERSGKMKTMNKIKTGFFKLDVENMSVCIDEEEIGLTRLEYQIIKLLYDNARKAVSYEQISENIWKTRSEDKKYRVANTIFHLRKKLERKDDDVEYIKTVRSRGYMLNI
ncbi:winged helix-turn-helix domain-containing protein [Candidatus Enterococcus mansonii]|uniref:OmpR/PhoB-type domain-containing protein n=1 Tax=Candidatus Enterococcus mansonii TaxID=1834181 RepID=A0A242CEU7_9ENTE|nr:winged helix-turn-helix domain-containing protein [Enterococcus sp. 4G2_DIV0659]OTO08763.1 hypothetical protein A5880_001763 [Enterococcus sp. 4G2_DIV0659]